MNMATTINNVLNIRDSVDDKSIFNSDSTDTSSEVDIIESCMNNLHIKRHFEVTMNHIGAGGFGVVYEARQKLDNRKYALKFVLIEQNFFEKREVEILASLDHANVLRYYTSWITDLPKPISNCKADEGGKEYDACLVIQTELCDPKKTLRTLMDSDRPGDKSDNLSLMDKRERHNIFLDIVSGLKYIHENGIMHRDLKPANIFIVKHNRAKIGDFGLARKYTMSDANGISPTSEKDRVCFSQDVGTYYYIAPEVKNSTVYDRKADFYSLGMILVELFHAWATEMGRYRTMNKLREQDFSDLKDISGNIQDVIQSLLSHEPSSRMELDMVINKVMKQLEPQESVEKDKVRAQPMNSPDMEYPRRPPRQISEASLGAPGENHQQIRATAGGLNLTKLTQQFKKTHVKKYIQREKDD